MKYRLSIITALAAIVFAIPCSGANDARRSDRIYLDSKTVHNGGYSWKMCRAGEAGASGERISAPGFDLSRWQDAVVPGTVLTSLVENKVYPDPYYGINNKLSENKIPDLSASGRDFYTYWFRTEFDSPEVSEGVSCLRMERFFGRSKGACARKAPWHSFRLHHAAMRRQTEVSRRPLVHCAA